MNVYDRAFANDSFPTSPSIAILSVIGASRKFFGSGIMNEQDQTGEQLKIGEAKFRELFNNTSDGVVLYKAVNDGLDFIIMDFNRGAEEIEKIKKESLIGKSVLEAFPGVKDFGLFDVFQRVWKTGNPEHHPVSIYSDNRVSGWRVNYVCKLPTGEIAAIYKDVTARRKAEEIIYESEKRYKRLLESVTDYIYTVQVENGRPVRTMHGPGCIGVTGYTTEDYNADTYLWHRMIHKDDREKVIKYAEKALSGEVPPTFEHRIIHKDGSIRWVANTIVLRFDEHHKLIAYDGLIKDITERILVEDALKESEAKYRSLVDSTDDSIYLVDRDCKYLFVNEKHLSRLGLSKDFLGKTYGEFHPLEDAKKFAETVDMVCKSGESIQHEHRSYRDDRYFIRTLSPVKDAYGKVTAVTIVSKDITQLKMMEEKLHALSITDDLTGLYNRRGFLVMAEQLLRLANRNKKGIFMLYADMDGLKMINDNFGHKEGDRALIETAKILKATYRNSDVIARIGGDEFTVIPVGTSSDNVDIIAARLQENLEKYNAEEKGAYKLSISAGIAYYDPENPCTIDELLREGDKIMYEQKKRRHQ